MRSFSKDGSVDTWKGALKPFSRNVCFTHSPTLVNAAARQATA